MKRFSPFIYLVLTAALTAALALGVGDAALCRPDHDPDKVRAGKILSSLRDGQSFELSKVYTQPWDRVQFAASGDGLRADENRLLNAYDQSLAESGVPLMLLWRKSELRDALPMPRERDGYPRFLSALLEENFSLSRDDAHFLSTFIPSIDGRGGYYQCVPVGEAL